ncbi:MAG: MEDS domain-containing protein [Minicystis sp.]
MGAVTWGTHLCHFYRTADDLLETLVPYFKAGLEQNERCLWVTSEPFGVEDARAALSTAEPRFAERAARGQIEILDHRDWYARLTCFEAKDVIAGWLGYETDALARGYAGLRLTGNTFWIADQASWDQFIDYEAMISEVFARRSILALCSYSTERCGCEGVFDVVQNHQLALVRRRGAWEVIENAALKLAKEELRRMNADLEQRVQDRTVELRAALRARDDFLGMASHELKTPLAALLLQLEGLVRPGRVEQAGADQTRERLGKALANGRRLAALVERMLDVSRLGQGLAPIDVQPVDLRLLAREVVGRLGDQLQAAGCATTLRERGEPIGLWDRSRLDQVLTNLVLNATKHARGTPIEIDVRADGEGAVLSVRDHGPGIAPADRARVFERFTQLDAASPEGFGLGLWIVRQIVATHGGSVHVEEAPGGGALFVVRLPLSPLPARGGDA